MSSEDTKVRHWSCNTCGKTEAEMEICRMKRYLYNVFGWKCPREKELEREKDL